jgi:hypothetical protein
MKELLQGAHGTPAGTRVWATLLLVIVLSASCGREPPHQESLEIPFREAPAEAEAVSRVIPLVAQSHRADQARLTPALESLFTYLAKTPTAPLARISPHAQGAWQIEKVFILDDCVAVQLTEGHYLETLLFSQHSTGWRLVARIRPEDHA